MVGFPLAWIENSTVRLSWFDSPTWIPSSGTGDAQRDLDPNRDRGAPWQPAWRNHTLDGQNPFRTVGMDEAL